MYVCMHACIYIYIYMHIAKMSACECLPLYYVRYIFGQVSIYMCLCIFVFQYMCIWLCRMSIAVCMSIQNIQDTHIFTWILISQWGCICELDLDAQKQNEFMIWYVHTHLSIYYYYVLYIHTHVCTYYYYACIPTQKHTKTRIHALKSMIHSSQ